MAAAHLADTLLTKVAEEGHHASAKVTVVGTGQVGMAAAFAMMTQVSSILLMLSILVCDHGRSTCQTTSLKPNSITLSGSKLVADLQRVKIWPIM